MGRINFSSKSVIKVLKNNYPLALLLSSAGSFGFLAGWNLFFRDGAYFLDTGLLQYVFCDNNTISLPPGYATANRTSSFLSLHGSFTPSIVCRPINYFLSNGPISFSMFLAIQTGLIAYVGYRVGTHLSMRKSWQIASGAALVLSSSCLGSLGYPHFEPIGAALLIIGAIRFVSLRTLSGVLFIALGCFTREDMGLHLLIEMLVAYILIWRKSKPENTGVLIRLSGITAFFVGLNIFITHIFFKSHNQLLASQYIGNPPFAVLHHPSELMIRLSSWLSSNPGIIALSFGFSIAYLVSRNKYFLVPPIASIPWILVNLIAPDPAKQILGIYETFPWIIYIGFIVVNPKFSVSLEPRDEKIGQLAKKIAMLSTCMIAMFSSLSGTPSGASYLLKSLLFERPASIANVDHSVNFMHQLSSIIQLDPGIRIDPAVASLLPEHDSRIISQSDVGVTQLYYYPTYVLGTDAVNQSKRNNKLK